MSAVGDARANDAVIAARQRRVAQSAASARRTRWFVDEVSGAISMSFESRVRIAVEFLKTTVVKNLSIPVARSSMGNVVERSKPGEFPRADTTRLMHDIFGEAIEGDGGWDGYVGTTLDYGLILETRMDRSFLRRTFSELKPEIEEILTGPMEKGDSGKEE